ncbi:MAG: alpha/beta fold hydrolase [Vulcanimicrobiaceae bacterium]
MQLTIDDARFDVLDEGRGTALVLLHGFPLAKEAWDEQAVALAAYARVIRIDLRGLGRSSVTDGPYLMETLAGDVASVLDALHVERAIIAGHSLGGYVAFAFYRLFTERCLGLGIVASRAAADDLAAAAAREALAARAEAEGMLPVTDAFVARYFAPEVYRDRPDLVKRARDMCGRTDPRGAAAMLRGIAERVCAEDLFAEIDVPVRIVAGERDAIVDMAQATAMAAGIRGATLDVVPCGHFPPWEAPAATTTALLALVRDVAAPNVPR